MLRVFACVTQHHQPWLLLLAALICALTSVAAFQMLLRARARDGRLATIWSIAGGVTAGFGVWATHFVAMTAYDVGLPIGFSILPLLGSLVISLLMQTSAFWYLHRARVVWLRMGAGASSGIGIALMHFVGTRGLLAPALMQWDVTLVVASSFLSVALSMAAFTLFKGSAAKYAASRSGFVFVLAICALHFTAMTALTLIPLGVSDHPVGEISRQMLGIFVGFGALIIVVTALVAALADAYLMDRQRLETVLRERVRERTAELAALVQEQGEIKDRAEAANIAKSQFLANMSHELRTPLNAVIGYSEILREDLEAAAMSAPAKDAGRILSAARNLLHLINEILDLSKIEAGKLDVCIADVDLRALLDEAISLAAPIAASKNCDLSLIVEGDLGAGRTDGGKLRQCLLNLLSNAVKFTEKGKVSVRVCREPGPDGDVLRFAVRDSGIGIGPEQLTRLFQPFAQADATIARKYGGTGLGLVITRKLAQLLGGDVLVNSVVGQGSEFTLRVRAALDSLESEIVDEMNNGPLILVVDDDAYCRDLIKRSLARLNMATRSTSEGRACLALANTLRPRLIVLDIRLPDLSGWQVLRELKRSRDTADIPVVVVTIEDDRVRSMELGACAHFTKPFDRDDLTATILRFVRAHETEPTETPALAERLTA